MKQQSFLPVYVLIVLATWTMWYGQPYDLIDAVHESRATCNDVGAAWDQPFALPGVIV